jgi:HK97 family phage major capsid protein
MGLKEKQERYSRAVDALHTAADAIESAADDANLTELSEQFSAAERECDDAKAAVELFERTAKARELAAPTIPDEPQANEPAPRVEVKSEPLTYERHSPHSVFRDMAAAQFGGDPAAQQRLARHRQEIAVERPNKYDLSSTDSAGGYLVAPLYLQDEFVDLARSGRVVANTIGSRPLPPNTDSVNLPTLATGTTVAAQTDNNTVDETDATFGTVAADVKTIAGLQDVSQQLLDRSVPGVDQIIFADLAGAYNTSLDTAVINSSVSNNKGLLQVTGINAVTYTDSTATVAEIYPKIADAVQQIHTSIYQAASVIFMHPRRWAFFLAAADGNNRPLITPYAPQNAPGTHGGPVAEGLVGSMQGLPVYVDANIPSTLGAGTNEDRIIVVRREECYLWEDQSGPYLETFRDVGSGTMTVRFRLHNYYAQCHERRAKAISAIAGTGLSTPSF